MRDPLVNRDPGDEDVSPESPCGLCGGYGHFTHQCNDEPPQDRLHVSESVYARWKRVHGGTDHDDACGWADGEHDDLGGKA